MSKDRMHYELLVRDALLSVVKAALKRVAAEGLPGNHHFFITFRTDAEGVEISPMLRAQYPEEMTIVLQNQYWGLTVDDEGFAVELKFNQALQTLRIPFNSLTLFHDPAVQFQLPFPPRSAPPQQLARHSDTPALARPEPRPESAPPPKPKKTSGDGAIVNLDAFRKK